MSSTMRLFRPLSIRTWQSLGAALLLIVLFFGSVRTQELSDSATTEQYKQLQKLRSERAMLSRILAAMNIVDSAYIIHYPSWVIKDEDIRQRVYKTFRNRLKFPARENDLIVIATPERDDIVRLTMGDESLGREETRLFIGDNLRKTIMGKNYPLRELEDVIETRRPAAGVHQKVNTISFEASLFGGKLMFSNGWGVEARVGNDALNMPFWSAGTFEALLAIDRFKVGAVLPLTGGLASSDIGPLTLPGRQMNGAPGLAVEFTQPVFGGTFGFVFNAGTLQKVDSLNTLTDPNHFYVVRSMAQGVFSQTVANVDDEHLVTLGIGVGYDKITRNSIVNVNQVQIDTTLNHINPIVRLDYNHSGARGYGANLQLYGSSAMLGGWIELVPNFVYIDLKYSTPVFRTAKNWENSYFVLISPRFRLSF